MSPVPYVAWYLHKEVDEACERGPIKCTEYKAKDPDGGCSWLRFGPGVGSVGKGARDNDHRSRDEVIREGECHSFCGCARVTCPEQGVVDECSLQNDIHDTCVVFPVDGHKQQDGEDPCGCDDFEEA